MRTYGSEKHYHNKVVGANSRLDELQAAFLSVKLSYLDRINQERRRIASLYNDGIINPLTMKLIEGSVSKESPIRVSSDGESFLFSN